MIKYNINDLYKVNTEKIKYICLKKNSNEYIEVFTDTIIEFNDKLDIIPLAKNYEIEVIKSYINESPLYLSKEELLIKFAEINSYDIYVKNMNNYKNNFLDEQEEYLKLLQELSIKNPEKAKEITTRTLKNAGIFDENEELKSSYDKVLKKVYKE